MGISSTPWAIVLAGGNGTRLQSLTTDQHGVSIPKQFCSLLGGPSLLRLALSRAGRVTPWDRIVTVVAEQHVAWWGSELADLPRSNVVEQPVNRGTAPGILLPLLTVAAQDPEATVLVLPSDHFVANEPLLEQSVRDALRQIDDRPEAVFLLGMMPDEADSQFGWIVPGAANDAGADPVDCFVEKPEQALAQDLLGRGGLWNSFIFAAKVGTLLGLYERRLPRLLETLLAAVAIGEDTDDRGILTAAYDGLETSDFSRDLVQGSEDALRVIPVPPCGWNDLGTADRVARCVDRLPGEGTWRPSAGPVVHLEATLALCTRI